MEDKDLKRSVLYEERFGEKGGGFISVICWIIAALLAVFVCFRAYVYQNFGGVVVDGASMNMTLSHGDKLLMHYTSKGAKAERGDVIVVYVGGYAEWQGAAGADGESVQYIIKRLIAKEGDLVKSVNGKISVQYDGESKWTELDEPYAYYSMSNVYEDFVYEVGEGEIFFLGDNRLNSEDSRFREGYSRLEDRLYKEEDIYGVVPKWSIENRKTFKWMFFGGN